MKKERKAREDLESKERDRGGEQGVRKALGQSRTIVVKVGTSTLTYPSGKLNLNYIEKIVRELADLKNQEKNVLLVSSGAIGAGMGKLGLSQKPRSTPEKQAVAAVGQGLLVQVYEKLFAEYGHTVAQVLLTRGDLVDRQRYINASNTLTTLLELGVIPIINENDTVAVEEIEFGDNDNLSALVACLVKADLLINLSDIDGLYTADPGTCPGARLVSFVDKMTPEIRALGRQTCGKMGTGGMQAKLQSAKITANSGITLVIANGKRPGIIHEILEGERVGTLFLPRRKVLHSRKRWIAFGLTLQGTITVDPGARQAITQQGKSLLPSGILSVQGSFNRGDTVVVLDQERQEIARGMVNYSAEELAKIKGLKTAEVPAVLGEKTEREAIHRDNLVIM